MGHQDLYKEGVDFVKKAMKAVINSEAVFPGRYGQNIDPETNEPTSDVTWGGGSDSFFEYLIKYAYLVGTDKGPWIPSWISSLSDYSKSSGGNLPRSSHLGCFEGGNWILGAKVLGIEKFNEYGLKLTESCINTYTSPTGIGRESFVYVGAGSNKNRVTIKDQDFYSKSGFDFEVTQYILRPEVIESVFYAWRSTGDKWQDLAWQAWKSIQNDTSTKPKQYDDSESFYAETFRYLYLTFADPNLVNLDEYVFTTEAHLFKVDAPSKSYHSESGIISEPIQDNKSKKTGKRGDPTWPPVPKFCRLPGTQDVKVWKLDCVGEDWPAAEECARSSSPTAEA